VSGGFQVAVAGLGLHLVGHQDVAAALDQVLFAEAQVGVTVGLVHGGLSGVWLRLQATLEVQQDKNN
jgi:hypothetical protein